VRRDRHSFNRAAFDRRRTDLSTPATFGTITSASGSGTRTIMFGAKLRF
jgi:hypothetical protein